MFFPDNTVLVNFGHINKLAILGQISTDFVWCEVVSEECAASSNQPGLASMKFATTILGPPWLPTTAERELTFKLRDDMLRPGDASTKHLGEAETIAIITSRKINAVFVTDDGGARAAALAKSIKVIDTWDLFRAAYRKDHLGNAQSAYADACILRTVRNIWPPCGPTLADFTNWIT